MIHLYFAHPSASGTRTGLSGPVRQAFMRLCGVSRNFELVGILGNVRSKAEEFKAAGPYRG